MNYAGGVLSSARVTSLSEISEKEKPILDTIHRLFYFQTEIEFLCAPDQDPGKLEFKYEASNAYVFNWFTKYACPEEPIECVVTNEDQNDHNQYDLSR